MAAVMLSESRKRAHDENISVDAESPPASRSRRPSNEFSPTTVATMAAEVGLLGLLSDDDFVRIPPALALPAAVLSHSGSPPTSPKQMMDARRQLVEATVHKQHKAYQRAIAACVYNAPDSSTARLLEPLLTTQDPKHTIHVVTRLSTEQMDALNSPARTLVEGLRGAVQERIESIQACTLDVKRHEDWLASIQALALARARDQALPKAAATGWEMEARVQAA